MAAVASESPFHEGERTIQTRLGVRDQLERQGRRTIRDHMPEQHRAFFVQLPFLLVGTVDARGRPWASMLTGAPGFVQAPDPRRLQVEAPPLPGDPLAETLRDGARIGVLGIELPTRRRNRLTGTVEAVGAGGFAIRVDQTFGNCPQYIQVRELQPAPATAPPSVERSERLSAAARALIERADTLFIATVAADGSDDPRLGADVSHRGGKPGFVRVEDDRTLLIPDFSGNFHFNTFGNILLNPKAGLLFPDFETGALLFLTGSAEILFEHDLLAAFAGAERFLRIRVDEAIRVERALPYRARTAQFSPTLDFTGSWDEAEATVAADRARNTYRPFEVVDVRPESASITSFVLRPADDGAPASHQAGQFLPIRLYVPGLAEPVLRTYTLSARADGATYRISVKREVGPPPGVASNVLHDQIRPGARIEAMGPRGKFTLDPTSRRPVVLVSAGVGITPMVALADELVHEGERTRDVRRVFFVHGARDGPAFAFGPFLRALADRFAGFRTHIRFSRPGPDDRVERDYDSVGRVDVDLLRQVLPFDDHEFYLCGPSGFMQSLHDGLIGLGVREERIRYESFGPATVLKRSARSAPRPPVGTPMAEPVPVRFERAGVGAVWTPEAGTLLDLAEAAGLSPAYACRSGICGTCATPLRCGAVDYVEEPSAPIAEGEVLICCSTPRPATGAQTCGSGLDVVLDL